MSEKDYTLAELKSMLEKAEEEHRINQIANDSYYLSRDYKEYCAWRFYLTSAIKAKEKANVA